MRTTNHQTNLCCLCKQKVTWRTWSVSCTGCLLWKIVKASTKNKMRSLATSRDFTCTICKPNTNQTNFPNVNPIPPPHTDQANQTNKTTNKQPKAPTTPPYNQTKQHLDLKILQLNVNGIRARKTELDNRLANEKPHVVCLQETWLKLSMKPPLFHRYNIAGRKDRFTETTGGGVLILVCDDTPYDPIPNPYHPTKLDPNT